MREKRGSGSNKNEDGSRRLRTRPTNRLLLRAVMMSSSSGGTLVVAWIIKQGIVIFSFLFWSPPQRAARRRPLVTSSPCCVVVVVSSAANKVHNFSSLTGKRKGGSERDPAAAGGRQLRASCKSFTIVKHWHTDGTAYRRTLDRRRLPISGRSRSACQIELAGVLGGVSRQASAVNRTGLALGRDNLRAPQAMLSEDVLCAAHSDNHR